MSDEARGAAYVTAPKPMPNGGGGPFGLLRLSVAGALAVACFHLATPSYFNSFRWPQDASLADRLEYGVALVRRHEEEIAFAKRPLTSALVRMTQRGTHLPALAAFFIVNFVLIAANGGLIGLLARRAGLSNREATASLVFFYISFTTLFCFFTPMDTYDEPVQYCLLLLAMLALPRSPLLASCLLGLSTVAKETSLFLVPALLIMAHTDRKQLCRVAMLLVIPVLTYVTWSSRFQYRDVAGRFSTWMYNFENLSRTQEGLWSLLLVLALPIALYLGIRPRTRRMDAAFVGTVVVNAAIVFVTGRAREARLFALPLLLVWPLLGQRITPVLAALRAEPLRKRWLLSGLGIGAILAAAYRPIDCPFASGYRVYCALTLASLCVLWKMRPGRNLRPTAPPGAEAQGGWGGGVPDRGQNMRPGRKLRSATQT